MSLSVVLKLLPGLSQKELGEVQRRVEFLAGSTREADSEDWLLDGMLQELRSRALWSRGSVPSRLLPKDFEKRSKPVRQFLLRGYSFPVRENHPHAELLALGQLASRVLMQYLTRIKVPVSISTVLNNVERVPEALEETFPGYWHVHGLGMILNRAL